MTQLHHSQERPGPLLGAGFAAAGAALVVAGTFAVSPVAPALSLAADAAAPAVNLTASIDPFAPWIDLVETTWNNASQVFGAVKDAADGFVDTLQGQFAAATFIGVDVATPEGSALAAQTLDWNHLWALQYMSGMDFGGGIPPIDPVEPAVTLLTMLSSPITGVLMGLTGPLFSPGVELINSIGSVVDNLGGGDFEAALQDVLAAPANVIGAFFNGATLSLDALVPLLNEALQVPPGNEILGASFDFGGIFTFGETEAGNMGGSFFNSLGLDLQMQGMGMPYSAPGEAVGLIASLVNLAEMFAAGMG